MRQIFVFLFLFSAVWAEQHPFVWGEYHPPAVTRDELEAAMDWDDSFTLEPLGGGYSGGLLYQAEMDGKRYVVRRSGGIFGQVAVPQEVVINQLAAKLGIAPRIDYANPDTGLIVMERAENILYSKFAPGLLQTWPDLMEMIAERMRQIHQLKPDDHDVTDRYFDEYVNRWAPKVDRSILSDEDRETFDLLTSIEFPRGEKVLNHNDIHTRNLLYDGENLLVIDWEVAGWGQRFYDLAYFANAQVMDIDQGKAFLALYLQREPTKPEVREFTLMRVMNATWGVVALLSFAEKEGAKMPSSLPLLNQRNNIMALDQGLINFGDPKTSYQLGIGWLRYAKYLLDD